MAVGNGYRLERVRVLEIEYHVAIDPRPSVAGARLRPAAASGSYTQRLCRWLTVELLSSDTTGRRPQQRDVGARHCFGKRQGVDIFRRIGCSTHHRAHAPGVERVHAYGRNAVEFRREHLREAFEGEFGH